jgi:S1-C subfamily serine protease
MKQNLRRIKKIAIALLLCATVFFGVVFATANAQVVTEAQRGLILNKPATIFISTYYEGNIIVQSSADYPPLSGKSYPFKAGMTGSGFVVNPDGYILTNGHVVKLEGDLLAYEAIKDVIIPIIEDVLVIEFTNLAKRSPTNAEMDAMMPAMIQELGGEAGAINTFYTAYKAGELKLDGVKRDVYVQQGAFLSGKKIPIQEGMKADVKIVDFDGFTPEGEVKGKDIGVIKVPQNNMPTTILGDSDKVSVGTRINAIGYPGVATFQDFLSKESQLEPTMTAGIISAVKTMKDGTKVLQTDAALTHGNSGGPAFIESTGEVIGIASLASYDKGGGEKIGFSYLRPSNLAKEFLNENNIQNKQGATDQAYRKALEYFYQKKYSKAIKEFETAMRLYPKLIDAQDYITKSQEGISRGEEVKDFPWGWVLAIGAVVIFGFVILIIIIVVLVARRKKKTATPAKPTNV